MITSVYCKNTDHVRVVQHGVTIAAWCVMVHPNAVFGYKLAIHQGLAVAQRCLPYCYKLGEGVAQDMPEVSMGRSLSSTQLLWPTCAIYCLSSRNLLVSLERSSAGRVQNMTIIFFRTSWTSFRTTLAGCEWILQGERA